MPMRHVQPHTTLCTVALVPSPALPVLDAGQTRTGRPAGGTAIKRLAPRSGLP
jgi:hypothetical protein